MNRHFFTRYPTPVSGEKSGRDLDPPTPEVYGRASINFYAFNSNGNKGIACGLNNLQKIRDGEPLGGKSRAEDDFASDLDDDFLS